MSKLFEATTNEARTENNAVAYKSTLDPNLDLFFKAGASRRQDISPLFVKAFESNDDYATRIALWTRDVRGGAGERQQFRNFLTKLIALDPDRALAVMVKIPEIGRWDDLSVYFGTEVEEQAAQFWVDAIKEDNGLAAKWAPRKDAKGAKPLRKVLGMKEAEWRKFVVERTEVVEQLMCANKWDEIDYEKVPSLASARYNKAFNRHDPKRRQEFRVAIEKGEATVKAGAVYPYDVVRAALYDDVVATKQWSELPNYLEGSKERMLPVVDVSGSMSMRVSGQITAMDVSVSLGIYLAERNESIFKNEFVTFSEVPEMISLKGDTLRQRYQNMVKSEWGFNTNLKGVFELVLRSAKANTLSQDEMPTKILILSDMQFDRCVSDGKDQSLFENMREQYAESGYQLPQIVFWNIAAQDKGNVPIKHDANGTALVSGFSPSIMQSLFGDDLDPMKVMLKTIMVDRYTV